MIDFFLPPFFLCLIFSFFLELAAYFCIWTLPAAHLTFIFKTRIGLRIKWNIWVFFLFWSGSSFLLSHCLRPRQWRCSNPVVEKGFLLWSRHVPFTRHSFAHALMFVKLWPLIGANVWSTQGILDIGFSIIHVLFHSNMHLADTIL